MRAKDSSLQGQSQLSQAQESVGTAHQAVKIAQTHPDEQMIRQAENSLKHAERAVAQATNGNKTQEEPIQMAQNDLQEDKDTINSLK